MILKKQIFKEKISKCIKTHPIVLFFAIYNSKENPKPINSNFSFFPGIQKVYKSKNLEETNLLEKNSIKRNPRGFMPDFSPKGFGENKLGETYGEKGKSPEIYQKVITVRISNKILGEYLCKKRLYGQTLLVAFPNIEESLGFYNNIHGYFLFLGGFYKLSSQKRIFFKHLWLATSLKPKIYRNLYKVFYTCNIKTLKCFTGYIKLLVLLKTLSKTLPPKI